ncbi:hypothetical protein RJ640_021148 [Escallonia rubra]|uniref:Ionotropic glutamate receptor C-terminal domain-containing protein n=1 Tax=Escallonia rubra TaxID=112253 RepID=A0AA88R1F6_9ASTE|nr:hypothetical protein RJ640_021148 [Escallonia rubra]
MLKCPFYHFQQQVLLLLHSGAYFFRATLNDSSQVKAIAVLVKAFGWRAAIPIYVDNEFGEGVIPHLTDALQEVDTRVPYRSVIHPSATDHEIVAELYKLMTMQTRVFIMHMTPSLGSRLFARAKEVGMMSEGYVWIVTDGLTNPLSLMDQSKIDSMQGVIGVKPHVPKKESTLEVDLNIFGLWAYDVTTALAIAVEKVEFMNPRSKKTTVSTGSMDLEEMAVSQFGKKLRQELSATRFNGLSGDFHIVNGQLESSVFRIVNLIGNEEQVIGFWTMQREISKIKYIRWPGESTSVPKGWVIPTNEKKLRIGVPVKDGSSDFVNVKRDPSTNTTTVTGFSIDVFEAVMATLPYDVPYMYVPFTNFGGHSSSYDDLIYQVSLGNYDAVVGDITIIANRSFTLPYTEPRVTLIVPVKDRQEKNAWVFLKPLTCDLWVTSACFFFLIGFLIWMLEHENQEFGGSRAQQLATSLSFSFSTMVFAHSNLPYSTLPSYWPVARPLRS